jgi:hypothetical protein
VARNRRRVLVPFPFTDQSGTKKRRTMGSLTAADQAHLTAILARVIGP